MQHIIKKQIIQLRLKTRQDAFHLQNRMSEHYRHDLLPVMETLFDEASTGDKTLYIDSLEIDLGVLTNNEIGRPKLDDEILALLTIQLREKLNQHSTGFKKSEVEQPATIGVARQWLFYMRHGYLPWNLLETDTEWMQKVLEALSTDSESITALRNLIRSEPASLTRLMEQHSESFLVKLIQILITRKQLQLSELIDELEIPYQDLPKIETRKKFWKIILKVSAAGESTGEEAEFLLDIKSKVEDEMDLHQNGHAEQQNEKPDLEEGIFVQQAGAVLLHPFLGTFFDLLQLTKAGVFKDLATQQKALCLVHYLCTGAMEAQEHELVIPKVLCGYPLKKPVQKWVELSEEEKEEASHLLEELIRQWQKLKNTSPAGLQEGFLQRAGKLVTKNDQWCIQVEANTIDILLDHLPWNLSIIKLPWLKDLIRVEWR
jgi:hypothetical protein